VFAGGWTLESAEAVCGPGELGLDVLDGLTSLVDQSLVLRTEPTAGHPRFSMLETIREFGQERLAEDGDLEQVRRRHAEHFLDLALAAEPHLTGADQGEWLDRCDLEQANLRAALRWAADAGQADRAQEAAGALWRFWQQRGHLTEGRRRLEELLALPSGREPTPARAKALAGAGGIAWWQEDLAAARRFYEEALAIERRLGDPARTADALYNQAFVVAAEGDFEGAFRLFEESLELFRRAGDEAGAARADWMMPIRDLVAGRWDGPVAKAEEAVDTWRRTGERFRLGDGLVWLAVVYARAGRPADARAAMAEARALFDDADSPLGMLSILLGLSYLARWEERYQDAVRLAGAADALRDQVGGRAPGFVSSCRVTRPPPPPRSRAGARRRSPRLGCRRRPGPATARTGPAGRRRGGARPAGQGGGRVGAAEPGRHRRAQRLHLGGRRPPPVPGGRPTARRRTRRRQPPQRPQPPDPGRAADCLVPARGASGRPGLERQHAADQRPPGDRADDAVDRDRGDVLVQGPLEVADGGVGLGAEDAVDLEALAGVAGQVAELELLLHPAYRVPLASLLDRDDQGRPGVGADDPVDRQALLLLEGPDGGLGPGPEDPVDGDGVAAGPEQVLEGLDGMVLVALADQREGTDGGCGHLRLLGGSGQVEAMRPGCPPAVPAVTIGR
jgi:tetratricopeptide (TPR) repeat protein